MFKYHSDMGLCFSLVVVVSKKSIKKKKIVCFFVCFFLLILIGKKQRWYWGKKVAIFDGNRAENQPKREGQKIRWLKA